jgi:hypothetical protein
MGKVRRSWAEDLNIKNGMLIYEKLGSVGRYRIPLSGIDTVVVKQLEPDSATVIIMARSEELLRFEREAEEAEAIQNFILDCLK